VQSIVNPLKAQSFGWHRWTSLRTIALGDDAIDVRWFESAAPHLDKRSNEDANHVVEEPTARDIEADDAWLRCGNRAAENGADRRLPLIGFMCERAEVVCANEPRCRGASPNDINGMSTDGGVTPLEWRGAPLKPPWARAIANPQAIAVRLTDATSHWIERLIDLISSNHFEVAWQARVERHRDTVDGNAKRIDAERRHLPARMHTCIGSACTEHRHSSAYQIVNRFRENPLRSTQFREPGRRLPLPAVEVGAVVRDQEAQSRHGVRSV
jgi:hypothetical protein